MERIDQYLDEHIAYLEEQYASEIFLASGRKVPRTGGIILTKKLERNELLQIIAEDPFKQRDLVDYELIEFIPCKTCKKLNFLAEY